MKQRYLFLFFLISLVEISFGQESDFIKDFETKYKRNTGKDFHERQALTLDELMLEKYGYQANSIRKKRNYIVYEYLITAKRKPYYVGEIFRFQYSNGKRYDLQLEFIDDSTFTTSTFNSELNTFDNQTFDVREIRKVFLKAPIKMNLKTIGTSLLTPLFYVLTAYAAPSLVDPKNQVQSIAGFYSGIFVGKRIYRYVFKIKRIRNNRRVRILKSY